jgi:hypothetical protein
LNKAHEEKLARATAKGPIKSGATLSTLPPSQDQVLETTTFDIYISGCSGQPAKLMSKLEQAGLDLTALVGPVPRAPKQTNGLGQRKLCFNSQEAADKFFEKFTAMSALNPSMKASKTGDKAETPAAVTAAGPPPSPEVQRLSSEIAAMNKKLDRITDPKDRAAAFVDKVRACRFFSSGQCHFGDRCKFAHQIPQPSTRVSGVCFDFRDLGKCERVGCSFAHTTTSSPSGAKAAGGATNGMKKGAKASGGAFNGKKMGVRHAFRDSGRCERGCSFVHATFPSPAATESSGAVADNKKNGVCHAFRDSGKCERVGCRFVHATTSSPADTKTTRAAADKKKKGVCHAFRDSGKCDRAGCSFVHATTPAATSNGIVCPEFRAHKSCSRAQCTYVHFI